MRQPQFLFAVVVGVITTSSPFNVVNVLVLKGREGWGTEEVDEMSRRY